MLHTGRPHRPLDIADGTEVTVRLESRDGEVLHLARVGVVRPEHAHGPEEEDGHEHSAHAGFTPEDGSYTAGIPVRLLPPKGGVIVVVHAERETRIPVGKGALDLVVAEEAGGPVVRWNAAYAPTLVLHHASGQVRALLTGGEANLQPGEDPARILAPAWGM